MTTWQLWQMIARPPTASPIYQWVQRQPGPPIPWHVGCAEMFAFLFIVPMVAFIGPVYGMAWVIGISEHLARAREGGTLDLLSLTPVGPLGASLTLAIASMYREGALVRINQRSTWAGRVAAVLLVAYAIIATQVNNGAPVLGLVMTTLIMTAALYPDHVQSISLACITGILAADFSTRQHNSQWLGFLLLGAVQAAVYGAALTLYLLLTGDDDLHIAVAAVAAVALLLLARELLFGLLWRALANRFGTATVLDLARSRAV